MTEQVIDPAASAGMQTATQEAPAENTDAAPAAVAADKATAAVKTIADTTGEDDAPIATTATWPEDWRERWAGNDEKVLSRLKRFGSPEGVFKSFRELEKRISQGDLRKALPEGAKPEEIAKWREENGIPAEPDGYKFDLDGFVPSENDKPILESFKQFAHGRNMDPATANDAVKWYFGLQEKAIADVQQADAEFRMSSTDALRAEWGTEYRANVNAISNYIMATGGEELRNNFLGARGPDGRLFGDNPTILKWLDSQAREFMPGAGLVPSGSANIGKDMNSRIAEIEAMMSSDPEKYYSGPDKELVKLYEAREKMQSRGKAA